MALTQFLSSRPIFSSASPSKFNPISPKPLFIFPRLHLKPTKLTLHGITCTAPNPSTPPPVTEQDIIEAVAESDGTESTLPAVRTYENDLARLTLVGAVDYQQALTAAAADGGVAADEHIAAGMQAMVVETVYPGSSDEHSTISTRLFLPAKKVKEKARRLKTSLTQDMFPNSTSNTILAVTFRQVVIQQLWNLELVLFRPGTKRNMNDIENPREVPASFAVSTPDERVISAMAEVVCLAALESTEKCFLGNSAGRSLISLFHWNQKPKKIEAQNSSVILYNLLDGIIANAKSLLKDFMLERLEPDLKLKTNKSWLQLDADKFVNVKLEGWEESATDKWEVLLTQSQMVALTSILDLYYDDAFAVPSRQLTCPTVSKTSSMSTRKSGVSLLKMLLISITSGLFLVAIGVLGQIYLPHMPIRGNLSQVKRISQSSEVKYFPDQSSESAELVDYCVGIVKRVKDSFGWPGDILIEDGCCAWTGTLPQYLSKSGIIVSSSAGKSDEEMKASAVDIASYQVVLATDGNIVGLQPTSRVAVNHWASNPLTKELYRGRNLSPGFVEPALKINNPSEVIVLELLMSVNKEAHFALVRPLAMSRDSLV